MTDDRDRPPIEPGAVIGHGYRVVDYLRRGHDLDVYDLWSEDRECRCVGKTVRPDRLGARGVRARLLREGRLLRRLTHPHLVRCYEVFADPVPFVILETLPGETLAHLVERRRLSEVETAHLGVHLCSAIGYLHRQGVLHLDLKPSNIVASHGLAKVLDLSLAMAPGRVRAGIGTVGYMSPEQASGGIVGPAADVWGIGATLFEAVSGEPPCDAGSKSDSNFRTLTACVPVSVRRKRRSFVKLGDIIDCCLSGNSADRPSVALLRAELSAICGS